MTVTITTSRNLGLVAMRINYASLSKPSWYRLITPENLPSKNYQNSEKKFAFFPSIARQSHLVQQYFAHCTFSPKTFLPDMCSYRVSQNLCEIQNYNNSFAHFYDIMTSYDLKLQISQDACCFRINFFFKFRIFTLASTLVTQIIKFLT